MRGGDGSCPPILHTYVKGTRGGGDYCLDFLEHPHPSADLLKLPTESGVDLIIFLPQAKIQLLR